MIAAGLFVLWTFDYGVTARRLPLLIGTSTCLLIVLDLLSRFRGNAGALIRLSLGAGFQDREMKHDPDWRSEVMQFIWVTSCVCGMALIGILPTIPLFIFLYMLLQGKQKIVFSLITSIVIVSVIVLVFEVLLDYDLYRGLLFNQDSFE